MPASEPSLEALIGAAGAFCLLALDHRDAMSNAFRRAGIDQVDAATILTTKARIARVLGRAASGILLDYDAVGCRPPRAGLLTPLEAQGFEPLGGARLTRLEFDAETARRAGADGCKLLLWYRADHAPAAARQRELLARAAGDCHRHGLPLVLEPLVYRLERESDAAFADAFADLVLAAAAELHDCDLLKLQYPGAEACAAATRAAAPLPWTLLGGGEVEAATFAGQLEAACAAGATGFIAGRTIWGGALGFHEDEQERWLEHEALPLLERLVAIAERHARSRAGAR
jgi:tagatose 1,6-diphosphate aldolase